MTRVILEIRGRVQGVGFRYHVVQLARGFQVSGTVRNLRSGSVEIDVEGDDGEVDRFIQSVLASPPRSARVEGTTQREEPPRYVFGFRVSP